MRRLSTSRLFGASKMALVLPLLLTAPSAGKDLPSLDGLDTEVERVLTTLDVPGAGVAVVKDGEVVLARGYGVRQVGEPGPVEGNTRFGVASNSKAFTCAALSILVEEGTLAWDDPVTRHVPELEMHDPWVTRELTVRDLVTHRAGLGLGAGDLMWWPPTSHTRDEIIAGVRHLEPATSFRTTYAYNNIMYVVAGEVVARVSGRPWGEFLEQRILKPLEMSDTTTSASARIPGRPLATPHVHVGGEARPIRVMSFENAAGAVGVNSTAADMARWLLMLLECSREEDVPEGQACVLKPDSIQQMWSSQTIMRTRKPPAELAALESDFAAYGLGFRLQEYQGRKVVAHGGAVPGYYSRVTLVPEERLGIAVLTNLESGVAINAIAQHIIDLFLGPPEPPVDWLEAFAKVTEDRAEKARAKVEKDAAARDPESSPSLAPDGYAGRYVDPWYGEATVTKENGSLVLDLTRTPGMLADLEHWQHDTFVARWRETWMSDHSPYDAYVTFVVGPRGRVQSMEMEPVSSAIDFSFDFADLDFAPVPPEDEPEG